MKGFNRHNIDHTSPSSINMYCDDPAAWVAKYLLNCKFSFSPAARAGVIAEEAVVNVLGRGWTQEEATKDAIEQFSRATVFDKSDKTLARGEAITGMIDLALKELSQYGEPEFDNGKQKKIEINCRVDDWTIPVIGFLDFVFPKHGLIVDMKTTQRMPSEMSSSHLRQRAIYKAANGNYAVKFLYVTGKKSAVFEPEDIGDTLKEIKSILRRQNAFLNVGDCQLLQSIVPVFDSYYWSDDMQVRRELYGH